MVIILRPFSDGAAGMIEAEEEALVEQLVAHASVEALDISILHWPSRRDVVPFDLVIFRPGKDGIRGEFGAVVGDDHSWLAASFDEGRQFASDATTGDRGVRDRRQAFARHVIDDVEHAEPPSAGELVVDEIQRPSGIGFRFDQDRCTRADRTPPGFALANGKPFLAIKAIDAVNPGGLSVPPK